MALSAPFCPLANLLNPDQSGKWLVGAVGIDPSNLTGVRSVCVERLPREHMRHRGAGEALVKAIEAAVKGDDFVLVE
jgi:hypothetical protein